MAPLLRIKNWEQFQHYSGTRAEASMPWLKLYRALLQDYDFLKLDDVQRWHLIGLWLLAGGNTPRGTVVDDAKFLARQISSTEKIDLDALVRAGWLLRDPASMADTDGETSAPLAASSRRGEERREEEKRAEYRPEFEAAWSLYPKRPNNAKKLAYRAWSARVASGVSPQTLVDATKGYVRYCLLHGKQGELIMQGATFFGPNERYADFLSAPADDATTGSGDTVDLYDPDTELPTEFGKALGL